MKKNVLVFPCGSEIGLELYKSLACSTHFNIIGGSSVDDHGKFVYRNYISDLPLVDNPDFIDKINAVVQAHKIDFIFPAHDSVVLKLAQEKAAGSLFCEVITSPIETCEIARSKSKTYHRLEHIIPTPEIYKTFESAVQDKVFLKPDVGQGSKGTYLAITSQEVEFYKQKTPSLLILEYLPGKEYTVDCFTNHKGELLFCEGRERHRISNGISVSSMSVEDKRFKEIAVKVNQELVFNGVWFFQVKENSAGDLVLMEIAPRIAGTMALARAHGVNLALLSLFNAMGYDVEVMRNHYSVVIDRALQNSYQHDLSYEHVYLDFDDLVIFEGKVNPSVMAYVYQCFNRGIKVHLLTRHEGDLMSSLSKYKLADVFDELIHVNDNDEKYKYIKKDKAIFIDDSFTERKKVYEVCKIPIFDSHMIESLMEKF